MRSPWLILISKLDTKITYICSFYKLRNRFPTCFRCVLPTNIAKYVGMIQAAPSWRSHNLYGVRSAKMKWGVGIYIHLLYYHNYYGVKLLSSDNPMLRMKNYSWKNLNTLTISANMFAKIQTRQQKNKLKNMLEFKSMSNCNISGCETFEIQIYVVYENRDLPSKFLAHNYVIKQNKSDFIIWAVHFYASVDDRKWSKRIIVKQKSLYTNKWVIKYTNFCRRDLLKSGLKFYRLNHI
jgi:hypothetical protein